ncbi:MAG: HAD hydrolase-like protein, partial [Actinomyces graevenitzii]|nr:HAD hydrolase-like protein [Actinomyces graevenitzii]
MSATLLGTTKPLVEEFELALLDLDGVCYSGADPVVHATDSVMAAKGQGLRTCFVTNNASRTPAQVVAKLAGFGIEADEQQIYTAAMDAVALLAEHVPAPATVLVVGGAGVEQALTEAGYTTTRSALDNPAAVVQGYDPSVDWAAMSEAAYAITNGALHVATNLDSTLPTERGFALGNGSLVAAVVHATERQPLAAGKPFAGIYMRAIARSGGGKAIAVGDRLNTDHAGARQSSLPSLHVLTGVASARDVLLAPPQYRPTFLH